MFASIGIRLSDNRHRQPYDQAPVSRQIRRRIASALRLPQTQIDQLRADLMYIDRTIALLDPNAKIDDVTVRPYRRSGYFSRGELSRRCLTALRFANGVPVSIDTMVADALTDKGLDQADVGYFVGSPI